MRIRTVKPEFHQSGTLATVSREVRGFAAALLNWADDEGYFVSIPAVIAGSLYPFDDDGREFVADGLRKLAVIGYLELFEGNVGLIPGLPLHQRINRPTKSRLKAKATKPLNLTEDSLSTHGGSSEASLPEGKGREGKGAGKGKGSGKGKQTASPAVISKAPEQVALLEAPKPPRAPSRAEVVFDLWTANRDDALEQLGAVHPDATYGPAWINKIFRTWFDLWAAVPFSPKWAELGLTTGAEVRCLQLFEAYLALDWPAKCVARVEGKDTETPQPYPFSALASEKVWKPLVAELWPEESKAGAA